MGSIITTVEPSVSSQGRKTSAVSAPISPEAQPRGRAVASESNSRQG
jgi:hypothetical protein